MARIEGVNLPRQKRIECGLTYIFGIGPKRAQDILTETGINPNVRVKDLTEEQTALLQKATSQYRTEGDLRQEIRRDIARLREIKSYRGSRHQNSLPARGQRTKTNARTRKGPRGLAIAGKKKVSKK